MSAEALGESLLVKAPQFRVKLFELFFPLGYSQIIGSRVDTDQKLALSKKATFLKACGYFHHFPFNLGNQI